MRILSVDAKLLNADGRTNKHGEANSRLRNFVKAPKDCRFFQIHTKRINAVCIEDRVNARLRRIIHD